MSDMKVVKIAYDTAKKKNVSDKVMLALFEAGLVESNFTNMSGGDRDSVGYLQQRPSQGWGTIEQCMNVEHATNSFLIRAIPIEHHYKTSGNLAQAVQRSAYPLRYDQQKSKAIELIETVSKGDFAEDKSSVIDLIKNPEEGFKQLIFNSIADFYLPITNFLRSIGIYAVLVILIFISFGIIYAQDELKQTAKKSIKIAKGVL